MPAATASSTGAAAASSAVLALATDFFEGFDPAPRVARFGAGASGPAFVAASAFVLTGGQNEDVAASRTAPMRTNAGEVVGDATLSTDPAAIRVEVPDWAGLVNTYGATVDATYWLAVEDGEGERALRRLPPVDEHPWTVELHDDPWEMNVLATRRGSAHYPSMLEDVESGRRTEIDLITGALVREAERHGVPAPLHTALYRLVKAKEDAVAGPTEDRESTRLAHRRA